MKIDKHKAEKAAAELLSSLGVDLSDENYKDTPKRMMEVLAEFTSALSDDHNHELEEDFSITFPKHKTSTNKYKEMVIQSPIRVYSMCSHHILPVIYNIAFAYIPKNGRLIGFSKIARVLRLIAKRPMNQEDFTQGVIEIFHSKLRPMGLAIVVSGVHLCMKMRGVRCDTINKTFAFKGSFKGYERTRDEFIALATNFNHPI